MTPFVRDQINATPPSTWKCHAQVIDRYNLDVKHSDASMVQLQSKDTLYSLCSKNELTSIHDIIKLVHILD
jgi:hypothetical protein